MINVTREQALAALSRIRTASGSCYDHLTELIRAFIEAAPEKGGEVFRICSRCNQEYQVPLSKTGICNFTDCPHCKQRDDVWIQVRPAARPAATKEPGVTEAMVVELEKKLGRAVALANEATGKALDDAIKYGKLTVRLMEATDKIESLTRERDEARRELAEVRGKAEKYDAINTPEIAEFLSAVENEALHQRERWGSDHDAGKTDADWFWLVGHLAGKALLKPEKALHHIITTAAALLNWHANKIGAHQRMRPGIGPDAQLPKPALATSSKGGGA